MFSSTHKLLDSDIMKKEHENYAEMMKSEEGVEELHLWARPRLAKLVETELEACDKNLVLLTTGRNKEKISKYITTASKNGFRLRLADVVTTLETSLKQNRSRPRSLPDDLVTQRHQEYIDAIDHLYPLITDLGGYYERFHPSNLGSLEGANAESLQETCKGLRSNAVQYIGVERDVYLDIKVNSISEINEGFKSYFRMDWRVSAIWHDPDLPPSAGLFGTDQDFDSMWITQVFPFHLEDIEQELVTPYCKLVQEKSGAEVRRLARWSSTNKFDFDLRRFPYDNHAISAFLYAPKTADKYVKFHIRKVEFSFDDCCESNSGTWLMYPKWTVVESSKIGGSSAPRIGFSIPVVRQPTSWIWNVEFMLFLLTGCIVVSAAVPPSNIEFRVSVIVGVLLTVFAFKVSIDPMLPTKGYFNALSSMLFWNMAVALILSMEGIFIASQQVSAGSGTEDRKWLEPLDFVFCSIVGGVWAAYMLIRTGFVLYWMYWEPVRSEGVSHGVLTRTASSKVKPA